jgi:hypothetical protein
MWSWDFHYGVYISFLRDDRDGNDGAFHLSISAYESDVSKARTTVQACLNPFSIRVSMNAPWEGQLWHQSKREIRRIQFSDQLILLSELHLPQMDSLAKHTVSSILKCNSATNLASCHHSTQSEGLCQFLNGLQINRNHIFKLRGISDVRSVQVI